MGDPTPEASEASSAAQNVYLGRKNLHVPVRLISVPQETHSRRNNLDLKIRQMKETRRTVALKVMPREHPSFGDSSGRNRFPTNEVCEGRRSDQLNRGNLSRLKCNRCNGRVAPLEPDYHEPDCQDLDSTCPVTMSPTEAPPIGVPDRRVMLLC